MLVIVKLTSPDGLAFCELVSCSFNFSLPQHSFLSLFLGDLVDSDFERLVFKLTFSEVNLGVSEIGDIIFEPFKLSFKLTDTSLEVVVLESEAAIKVPEII